MDPSLLALTTEIVMDSTSYAGELSVFWLLIILITPVISPVIGYLIIKYGIINGIKNLDKHFPPTQK